MSNNELFQRYKKAITEIPRESQSRRGKDGFYVQWHITDLCNLRCKHCYYGESSIEDLPLSQLKEIFDKYLKTMLKWKMEGNLLCLTGGEPMMRRDFFELLDYIRERWKEHPQFSIALMSNGTLTDEEFALRLKSYRPMIPQIQISVDGVQPETHDFIRGRGSFEKTKRAFHLLRDQGFGTALHYVVSKSNYRDTFNILELGAELGAARITVSRLVPEGRGNKLELLTPSELRDLWIHLSEKCLDFYSKGVFLARGRCDLWHLADMPSSFYSLRWGAREKIIPHYLRVGQRCPVGVNGLTIDSDGTVYPCRRLPIPIGNITEDTFFKIWYSSKLLWKLRYKERHMKGKCQDCPFLTDDELRPLCAGGNTCIAYGECGDCFLPDTQCWFDPYSEEQLEEVEKWKKLILRQEKTFSS